MITDSSDAQSLINWIEGDRPVLGVDTETEGLDFWRDKIRMVQVGDTTRGWAIPFPEWGGLARQVIDNYRRPVAMHNAKFDIHMLETAEFKLDRSLIDDTRILAHLLDNDNLTGLKPLSTQYVDARANVLETQLKDVFKINDWNWRTIPTDHPAYWQYAALDPVITTAIHEITSGPVAANYRDAYDLELTASQVLVDMETRGVKVDTQYSQDLALRIWDHCDYLIDRGLNEWNVGLTKNDQIADALIADGVELFKRTKSGKFAMDEEILEPLDHPLSKLVLEHRGLIKVANTYLKNFIDLSDADGILHPSLNLLGAKTGRMSVSRPSLQNLERASDVRNAFIARPDHTLLLIDYDQIEMRLFAHYCKSEKLINAFAPGGEVDGFTQMAREIRGDPTITKDDPRRQTTKNAGYGKIYGAGVSTFAATAHITDSEAFHFMNQFDETYPEVNQFLNAVVEQARSRLYAEGVGYVNLHYGNRRLVLHNSAKLYKLVNYLIQGTAAQVLKDRIIALDLAGLTEYLVLPVHDELVFDIPKENAEEIAREIQQIMMIPDRFAVPLTTSMKFVDRWGDAYSPGKAMKVLNR